LNRLFIVFLIWLFLSGCVSESTSVTEQETTREQLPVPAEEKEFLEHENPEEPDFLYPAESVPENFKVAFLGDQGTGENPLAVMNLIKREETDMVIHLGDFDYEDNPDKWESAITNVFGDDFPWFSLVGNHDVPKWNEYQKKIRTRIEKIEGAECIGDIGVRSACSYKGIYFILSGFGTMGSGHEEFIREQLSDNDFLWKICAWHINEEIMQVGTKDDHIGWTNYNECRKAGAIIASADEHSYSRTHLIGKFDPIIVASKSNTLIIDKGHTFSFVSGLGGHSIRHQLDERVSDEWWASIYTMEQDANFGALFCIFNKNGTENRAHCYFKDIDEKIADDFYVINKVE